MFVIKKVQKEHKNNSEKESIYFSSSFTYSGYSICVQTDDAHEDFLIILSAKPTTMIDILLITRE